MGLSLKRVVRFAPREPRAAVAVDSLLLLPDDRTVPVTIRNISADGFMGEVMTDLQLGTWFGVAIPCCGIVRARVRWSEPGAIGAQFGRSLDVELIEQWRSEEEAGIGFLEARVRRKPFSSLRGYADDE